MTCSLAWRSESDAPQTHNWHSATRLRATLHRTTLAALRPCAGKTLQTISVLWTLLRQGPVHNGLIGGAECVNAIVISPTSLVLNWKAEVPQRVVQQATRPPPLQRPDRLLWTAIGLVMRAHTA